MFKYTTENIVPNPIRGPLMDWRSVPSLLVKLHKAPIGNELLGTYIKECDKVALVIKRISVCLINPIKKFYTWQNTLGTNLERSSSLLDHTKIYSLPHNFGLRYVL